MTPERGEKNGFEQIAIRLRFFAPFAVKQNSIMMMIL